MWECHSVGQCEKMSTMWGFRKAIFVTSLKHTAYMMTQIYLLSIIISIKHTCCRLKSLQEWLAFSSKQKNNHEERKQPMSFLACVCFAKKVYSTTLFVSRQPPKSYFKNLSVQPAAASAVCRMFMFRTIGSQFLPFNPPNTHFHSFSLTSI